MTSEKVRVQRISSPSALAPVATVTRMNREGRERRFAAPAERRPAPTSNPAGGAAEGVRQIEGTQVRAQGIPGSRQRLHRQRKGGAKQDRWKKENQRDED